MASATEPYFLIVRGLEVQRPRASRGVCEASFLGLETAVFFSPCLAMVFL